MKHCRVCKTPKEESEFAKCAAAADGLQATCRGCSAAYHRTRYYEDLERSRKESRECARRQREKNPEKIRAQQREYRKDPVVKEKARLATREYNKKYPDYNREYRRLNPDKAENTRLKTKYGITLEEKQLLVSAQGGGCAVCEAKTKLDVDHDHKSGKVRGLLCRHCNTSLGLLRESPAIISSLLEYLKKHS